MRYFQVDHLVKASRNRSDYIQVVYICSASGRSRSMVFKVLLCLHIISCIVSFSSIKVIHGNLFWLSLIYICSGIMNVKKTLEEKTNSRPIETLRLLNATTVSFKNLTLKKNRTGMNAFFFVCSSSTKKTKCVKSEW